MTGNAIEALMEHLYQKFVNKVGEDPDAKKAFLAMFLAARKNKNPFAISEPLEAKAFLKKYTSTEHYFLVRDLLNEAASFGQKTR